MSNSLTVEQLRSQLSALGVDNRGHRNELRARLRKRQQQHQQQYLQPQQQQQRQQPQVIIQRRTVVTTTTATTGGNGSSQADSATSWRRSGGGEERVVVSTRTLAQPTSTPAPAPAPVTADTKWKPIMDSYLVLDVEATCERGKLGQPRNASFEFPNEIIEFPVVLLQWREVKDSGRLELYIADIFHTYVKPVWRPKLTQFCRGLTGIDQNHIDSAPSFAEAVDRLHAFLASHGLLEAGKTRQILSRRAKASPSPSLRKGVCWCTHGPFDLLSFVVKQSYISGLAEGVPSFLRGPLIDVKLSAVEVTNPRKIKVPQKNGEEGESKVVSSSGYPFRDTTVDGLLAMLQLDPFQGRHHSGLDDTKNIARIFAGVASRVAHSAAAVTEEISAMDNLREVVALERATLLPNTQTEKSHLRRWDWMSSDQPGQIIWSEPEEV